MPRLEPGDEDFAAPAGPVLQQWEDGSRRVIATGGVCSRGWWMEWDGLATFVFDQEGDVFVRAARPGMDPTVRHVFEKAVLPIVMVARGYEAFHASAVRVPSGVIGFLGLSGTGKSTTAEALTRLGLDHYADDTLVYRLVGDRPLAVRLNFPGAIPDAGRTDGTASASDDRSESLHRIYHLRRDPAQDPESPAFVQVPPAKRFDLLLTHAHPFDMGPPARRRAFITNVMTVARVVDVWECHFAPDVESLPSLAGAIKRHADAP